ncbi:TonB family protein [Paraburkholderia sp. SIMBA_030]|uniref:energy transducer TonB n=1 Tax=Paraburkholderia sp. SIMBA_030 TaxID=3085773 RepID=UPI0039794E3D
MNTSTLNSAHATRRRMRSLHLAAAVNPPVHVGVCRLPPQTIGAFDDLRRTRVHAVALVVLAVHCVIALKAWRVSVENQQLTAPHALDLQFDVRAAVPAPAPAPVPTSPQSAGFASSLPPRGASPAPHRAITPHRARDVAAAKSTDQASQSKPLARTAPDNVSKPQPASAIAQASATHADPETPNTSAAKLPDAPPAPEPLTEPSFGAAYLHNPPPAYPGVAQQRGWQGTVLLRVHVLANGRPDQVGLASSSGHASLDDAALEAVTGWHFAPARRGNQAIDEWVQVPIDFKLGT